MPINSNIGSWHAVLAKRKLNLQYHIMTCMMYICDAQAHFWKTVIKIEPIIYLQ